MEHLPHPATDVSSPVVTYNPLFMACHNPVETRCAVVQDKRGRQYKKGNLKGFGQFMRHHLVAFSPFQFAPNAKWPLTGSH